MDKKKALIVDDSKLARFVLKEMLNEYGLAADTTESAEEALGYLCTQRPDVIFMDHTMPGMDGFKAVEAIKQDPQTTAIPIMMYTSKEGEMYVSQARALGAIGVLPKQLKSVELGKVLEQLGLIGEQAADNESFVGPLKPAPAKPEGWKASVVPTTLPEVAASAVESAPAAGKSVPKAVDVSLTQLSPKRSSKGEGLDVLNGLAQDAEQSINVNLFRPLIQELLDLQREQIRGDIRKSAITVARRLAGDESGAESDDNDEEVYVAPVRPRSQWQVAAVVLVAVLIPFAWFIDQHNATREQVVKLQDENRQLQTLSVTEESPILDESIDISQQEQFMAMEARRDRENSVLIEAIEWAMNNRNTIPYDESALGDTALDILSILVPKLIDTEFRGAVVLKSHNAEFCVVEHESGELRIPDPSHPFAECKLVEQELNESIEFTNYVTTLRESGYQAIQVRIENRGNLEPLMSYPEQSEVKTAGEWNAVAQINNRLEIGLEREQKGIALN